MRKQEQMLTASKLSIQYAFLHTPATVSLMLIPYVKGIKGLRVLKKSGRTSTGKVPPAPATWTIIIIMAIALPISPKSRYCKTKHNTAENHRRNYTG